MRELPSSKNKNPSPNVTSISMCLFPSIKRADATRNNNCRKTEILRGGTKDWSEKKPSLIKIKTDFQMSFLETNEWFLTKSSKVLWCFWWSTPSLQPVQCWNFLQEAVEEAQLQRENQCYSTSPPQQPDRHWKFMRN